MSSRKPEDNRKAKRLTDEEIKTVAGGMKIAVDDEKSWWRTIMDFSSKIKTEGSGLFRCGMIGQPVRTR